MRGYVEFGDDVLQYVSPRVEAEFLGEMLATGHKVLMPLTGDIVRDNHSACSTTSHRGREYVVHIRITSQKKLSALGR